MGDVAGLGLDNAEEEQKLGLIVAVLRFITDEKQNGNLERGMKELDHRHKFEQKMPVPEATVAEDRTRSSDHHHKKSFAATLAKFDDNPKSRLIPVCGIRQRNL